MHYRLLASGLLLLAVSAPAHADWYDPPDALHSGPTLDLGYSWGGDDLNRPDLVAGHKDVSGTYYAGEGLSAGIGMIEQFGDDWGLGLKQEAGAWLQFPISTTSWNAGPGGYNSDTIVFLHSYFDFLAFAHWDVFAIGGGSVLQTHVQAQGGKVSDNTFDDFENAHGWLVMFQYRAVSVRYTHVQYRVKHVAGIPPVDGSNLGIYLSWQFF